MSLRLILMRHAKSDWSGDLSDHDRPLNARGRTAARAMGGWLGATGHTPRHALISTATRAVETWAGLGLAGDVPVTRTGALYLASPNEILRQIRRVDGSPLIVIGHNPGFQQVAAMLAAHRPDDPAFARYPTGAALVLDFDIRHWADLGEGKGRVTAFQVPRRLGE